MDDPSDELHTQAKLPQNMACKNLNFALKPKLIKLIWYGQMDSWYVACSGWLNSLVSQVAMPSNTWGLYSKLGSVSPESFETKKSLNYVSAKSGQDHFLTAFGFSPYAI